MHLHRCSTIQATQIFSINLKTTTTVYKYMIQVHVLTPYVNIEDATLKQILFKT